MQFNVNFGEDLNPAQQQIFIELKSNTWSARDADFKAAHVQEMLRILGIEGDDIVTDDYLEILPGPTNN